MNLAIALSSLRVDRHPNPPLRRPIHSAASPGRRTGSPEIDRYIRRRGVWVRIVPMPTLKRGFGQRIRSLRRLAGGRSRSAKPLAELSAGKSRIEEAFGPWTAHNCQLAPGLWTVRPESVNFDEKVRRCLRIANDFFGSDLSGLRVLDLGAGEGGLSLEFAAQGARVVCVDGRQMNVAKAEFAASALGLDIEFRCQDVRALSTSERYDLVLCFGL